MDTEAPPAKLPPRNKMRTKAEVMEHDKDVIMTTSGKKKNRNPPSEKQLEHLAKNRVKALEVLTSQRRAREEAKAKKGEEEEEIRHTVEMRKLDAAPKVKQIDSDVVALKAELDSLKKQFSVSVPHKIAHRDALTGNELLDKLFFSH